METVTSDGVSFTAEGAPVYDLCTLCRQFLLLLLLLLMVQVVVSGCFECLGAASYHVVLFSRP